MAYLGCHKNKDLQGLNGTPFHNAVPYLKVMLLRKTAPAS
jgi:hypothetical protein